MRNSGQNGARARVGLGLALLCIGAVLGGCSSVGPAPWDHDLMARRSMQLNPHPDLMAALEHSYFSKEGASGGRSFVGGGCGCN
jgi:Domain of unknown function (DUF4266)